MCDSITTYQTNNSRQAFPTMVPLRVTFRRIPCLVLPCGKRQHDGRCQCGSGFGSKLRAQLFCENLGEFPGPSPRPGCYTGPTVRATGNGGGCCSPRPTCSSARLSSQSQLGLEGGDTPYRILVPYRIFRMQYCTLLLDAELIICRLHYYFSEGMHGRRALQHHISGKLFHLFY